jgi:hypothetical protein
MKASNKDITFAILCVLFDPFPKNTFQTKEFMSRKQSINVLYIVFALVCCIAL